MSIHNTSNNTTLGCTYEINDIFDFWGHHHLFLNFSQGIGNIQSALVDDAVCIVNLLNGLVRETAATQAHDVNATIDGRLTSRYDVRRYVF